MDRLDGLKRLDDRLEAYLRDQTVRLLAAYLRQDSGCRSYAVEQSGERWFVKQAVTARGCAALERAEALHAKVCHPALPTLCNTFEAADGRVHVYDWVPSEVLYDYVNHPGEAGRANPRSVHARFRALPAERIIHTLNIIYDAHLVIADAGFVAVDFYDGCILYDFEAHRTWLCDLDEYRPGPFILEDERLPGSTRFMAPEEFRRGATIDQRTTVYALARASVIPLGDGNVDSPAWRGGSRLRDVVRMATAEDPAERHPTIRAFVSAWREALLGIDSPVG